MRGCFDGPNTTDRDNELVEEYEEDAMPDDTGQTVRFTRYEAITDEWGRVRGTQQLGEPMDLRSTLLAYAEGKSAFWELFPPPPPRQWYRRVWSRVAWWWYEHRPRLHFGPCDTGDE